MGEDSECSDASEENSEDIFDYDSNDGEHVLEDNSMLSRHLTYLTKAIEFSVLINPGYLILTLYVKNTEILKLLIQLKKE